jgi:hypothetical protein
MAQYEAIYGPKSLSVTSYLQITSKVWSLDNILHTREAILHTPKENLVMDQSRMKQEAYQYHCEHSFVEGDHVFILLQHYK